MAMLIALRSLSFFYSLCTYYKWKFCYLQEWVDVKVLEVSEGGRALLTSEHLKVVVDYAFYGIPESGVLFHMAQAPAYGRLDVTVWDRQEDNIFTLLDLNTDQVSSHGSTSQMEWKTLAKKS